MNLFRVLRDSTMIKGFRRIAAAACRRPGPWRGQAQPGRPHPASAAPAASLTYRARRFHPKRPIALTSRSGHSRVIFRRVRPHVATTISVIAASLLRRGTSTGGIAPRRARSTEKERDIEEAIPPHRRGRRRRACAGHRVRHLGVHVRVSRADDARRQGRPPTGLHRGRPRGLGELRRHAGRRRDLVLPAGVHQHQQPHLPHLGLARRLRHQRQRAPARRRGPAAEPLHPPLGEHRGRRDRARAVRPTAPPRCRPPAASPPTPA